MKNANEIITGLINAAHMYRMCDSNVPDALRHAISGQLEFAIDDAQEYLSNRKQKETK